MNYGQGVNRHDMVGECKCNKLPIPNLEEDLPTIAGENTDTPV